MPMAATAQANEIQPAAPTASKPPYEIRNGEVYIPGWDDRSSSKPTELLRITAEQFPKPAIVYRGRVIMEQGDVVTSSVLIPAGARELVVLARARPVEDEFPYIKISIIPDAGTSATELYAGFVQTLSLEPYVAAIPEKFRGTRARISVSMLNPAPVHDRRAIYIASIVFR